MVGILAPGAASRLRLV